MDIRCGPSDKYIESFNLNYIPIVIRKLNGYIGWFGLSLVFFVICIMDGFIECFNVIFLWKVEHAYGFIIRRNVWTKHDNVLLHFMGVNSETLVFLSFD